MTSHLHTPITSLLRRQRVFLDGGTGSFLQARGLPAGQGPERWNLERPEEITGLHRAYYEAGCNAVTMNTFGVNSLKYDNYAELIRAAFACADRARSEYLAAHPEAGDRYIALDIGPTGRLLQPLGDLAFEDAVEVFAKTVREGAAAGADLVIIETMNDSYETKAAVLAVKENSDLPVFVSNVYDGTGKLMTGANPGAMVALAEGLRCDAVGMNCSLGPAQMEALVPEFVRAASVPVLVMPNAGLPRTENGQTVYDVSADDFAASMKRIAEAGAHILGGCCGTTPEYLKKTIEAVKDVPYTPPFAKESTVISSSTHAVELKKTPLLVGERINPTGKKRIKEALRAGQYDLLFEEGIRQAEEGAPILDVNAGLPEIDEPAVMAALITGLQAVTDACLQADTTDPAAMEAALRLYNGKALINSVNGTKKSRDAVLPLAAKYGGVLVALLVGEEGIPETAEGRLAVARLIAEDAARYGIPKKDMIADPLTMAVSAQPDGAQVALESIRLLKEDGFGTMLGVSNISFGLPARDRINAAFFTMALAAGLDLAIMNPFSETMMGAYKSFLALTRQDEACGGYIAYAQNHPLTGPAGTAAPAKTPAGTASQTPNLSADTGQDALQAAIATGRKGAAEAAAKEALSAGEEPLSLINTRVIPALNAVGEAFEQKRAYLPQLLMSAEAATGALDIIKAAIPEAKTDGQQRRGVILATVQGDIHDIGKNIVKVLLESYGFTVYDLGRDVAPERVAEEARRTGCRLVGLSALMTTTVPAMEATIRLLHETFADAKVMVGGAVLTPEYAAQIGADYYGKDAMESVHIAEEFYG